MANAEFPRWLFTKGLTKDEVCCENNIYAWHYNNNNSKNVNVNVNINVNSSREKNAVQHLLQSAMISEAE